ncbi:NADH dehydrogenase subunit A [Syntrophus gentianae]|uniref:NADH-quinone oxidoreductase subunit A n=1 Tax=Syntrophus gentianae TaxID=43775 RepID=A0A1H7ZL10_9BACT|nr:NADH-quinone oxidoreductase subunit A [Syntrophus gentianae]SEM58248.1 NADH dehydrogenase subunit A [Syntrophus gentianae]
MLLNYLPVAIYLLIAIGFGAVVVFLSSLLGPKMPGKVKLETYECGMEPIGPNRLRTSIKFYVIAMLFIIFDIEAVFLYPWAVVFKELKIFGLVEMGIFIAILFAGLAYVWRKGALEWD